MTHRYELTGYFTAKDRTSQIVLGIVEINENDMSGGQQGAYLLGIARATFSGLIAKEEGKINGRLTQVVANRKGKSDNDSDNPKEEKSSGGIGKWAWNQLMKPYKG